jgi:tetratricopeptide (TPR) repeat protein
VVGSGASLPAAPLDASPPSKDEASRSIARGFYEEARSLAATGKWKAAASLLAEANAYDGTDSDILYLSGLAAREAGVPLGEALAELDAAVAAGRFSDYAERDARTLAAEILGALRRWDAALSMLPPAGPDSSLDPRYRLVRVRAFSGLGDSAGRDAELSEAMRRFPDDPRFPRLLFSLLSSTPPARLSSATRDLVELALSRVARYAQSDPELAVLAAPFMPDPATAVDAVLAFRASGGKSAQATLRAFEYGLVDEAKASAELFSGDYPVRLADILSAFALARSEQGRSALASALASFSGRIETDRDADGIAEESIVVERGLAVSCALDLDQDRAVETELSFADGLPRSAVARSKGSSIEFEYAAYPVLASARIDGVDGASGTARSFALEAGALSYAPVEMTLVAGSGKTAVYLPTPTGAAAPTERALAASALSSSTIRKDESELLFLDRGVPLKREVRVGGLLVSITDYRLGLPILERADLDGDGRFETERGYEAGGSGAPAELAWARVDADGDGLFEYREEARFPFRKEWDLDGNGSVDAVRYLLPDGSIRNEYSSRLDGRFDEALVLRARAGAGEAGIDDEIVVFSKGGASVPLVPDANPSLLWIGTKPFDFGTELPAGEGVFSRDGKRYRIVKVGSRLFAELVP